MVCLQEAKAPDEKFPETAIRAAGYGAIWHGQKSWNGVAILARGAEPMEIRRGLPGDPDDTHSRYIEAAIDGMTVGCLYLPNGNPAPGPRFDYKLRWFDRLAKHAKNLLATGEPVVLAGDYNVMPTDLDVMRRSVGLMTRCFGQRCAKPIAGLLSRGGRTRCGLCTQVSGFTRSGNISGTPSVATLVSASITCCSVRHWRSVSPQPA